MSKVKEEKEIVKYHNDLNTVGLNSLTAEEMNLLFAMCHKVRNEGLRHLEYSFREVQELVSYSSRDRTRFARGIKNTYKKMLHLNFGREEGLYAEYFNLFTYFKIDPDNDKILVSVNEKWDYILNRLEGNFTRFELAEFVSLRSIYAKSMYRILKQYRSTGFVRIHIEEFRRLLSVPKSYQMSHINDKILAPIQRELSVYFEALRIEKVKKRGEKRKIEYLEFHFKKQAVVLDFKGTGIPLNKAEQTMGQMNQMQIETTVIEQKFEEPPFNPTSASERVEPVQVEDTPDSDKMEFSQLDVFAVVGMFEGLIRSEDAKLLLQEAANDIELLESIATQVLQSSRKINNLVGYVLGVLKAGYQEPVKMMGRGSKRRVEVMPEYLSSPTHSQEFSIDERIQLMSQEEREQELARIQELMNGMV